jgi:hypothetical protein
MLTTASAIELLLLTTIGALIFCPSSHRLSSASTEPKIGNALTSASELAQKRRSRRCAVVAIILTERNEAWDEPGNSLCKER